MKTDSGAPVGLVCFSYDMKWAFRYEIKLLFSSLNCRSMTSTTITNQKQTDVKETVHFILYFSHVRGKDFLKC